MEDAGEIDEEYIDECTLYPEFTRVSLIKDVEPLTDEDTEKLGFMHESDEKTIEQKFKFMVYLKEVRSMRRGYFNSLNLVI